MQRAIESAKGRYNGLQQAIEIQLNLWGIDTRDDRGAITIETVVVTAILAVIAVAAGVVLLAKMNSNAAAIPDAPTLPG